MQVWQETHQKLVSQNDILHMVTSILHISAHTHTYTHRYKHTLATPTHNLLFTYTQHALRKSHATGRDRIALVVKTFAIAV